MIDPKQIPDEVARAIATSMGWESAIAEPSGMERFKGHIAAGLAAWPGRKDEWRDNITFDGKPVRYSVTILPLQETEK